MRWSMLKKTKDDPRTYEPLERDSSIPAPLIERLKPFGQRFIRVKAAQLGNRKSGKQPIDNAWQLNPLSADAPEILQWRGNYGIICGKGFMVPDLDSEDEELLNLFPETFTVRSGSGRGRHLFLMSDVTENATIFDKDGEHVGDLQANAKQVVGPGSRHHSGGTYEIINDVPFAWLSRADLDELFEDSPFQLRWSSATKRRNEDAATREISLIGHDIPLAEIIDMKEMREIGDHEYQGVHPVHGSATGQNFNVNTEKNCWHCFRCNSGGGPLSWIAVAEGLIECHEARPGKLRGALYRRVETIVKALGYELEEFAVPSHIPEHLKKYFTKNLKRFIPEKMVDEILESYRIKTFTGPETYIYNERMGVYDKHGSIWLPKIIKEKLGESAEPARISAVYKLIQTETMNPHLPKVKPELVVVANGLLNLRTGELRPYTSDEFMVARIPVDYSPDADKGVVETFVSEIVSPRDGLSLQEFCGYCLWRDYFIHKAFMLVGTGRNGKSTFIQMLRAMLGGDANVSAVSIQDLTGNRFAAAHLEHKFANLCSEMGTTKIKLTDKFKALTGGDTVYAERKFMKKRPFMNYAKMMCGLNDVPKVDIEESLAFFSRWEIITFPNKFEGPNCDLNIIDKLTTPEALTGMLRWAVEGLHRLLEQKRFTESQSSTEVMTLYTKLSDPILHWIENFTEPDGEYYTPKEAAYMAYVNWCIGEKLAPLSRRAVNKKMEDKYTEQRKTVDGKHLRVWGGCRIGDEGFSIHQGGGLIY